MANNYHQATVTPDLPAAVFSEEEREALEIASGLTGARYGDKLYFFADTSFREEGEYDRDGKDVTIHCLTLFQEKLHRLDPVAYPCITIHGAATCSKMRPNEFGGFAILITRDAIRSMSTWQWLEEQEQSLKSASATPGSPDRQPE